MRYLIETHPDHAMQVGAQIAQLQKADKIKILEKGDPIEEIKSDLLRIKRAFETLKKLGINEEILIAYIRTKGFPMQTIKDVLYHQEQFFIKLGVK